MAVVHYFLQDEGRKDLYMYMIEGLMQEQVKFKNIISTFPEPGRFHFRFRIAMPEGNSATAIWMDYIDPERSVPLFKGNIIVKALQLPPFSNLRLRKQATKTYKAGLSELYRAESPTKPRDRPTPAKPAVSKAQEHLRRASPTIKVQAPPEPQPVQIAEAMISFSPFKESESTDSFFSMQPQIMSVSQKQPSSEPPKSLNETTLREEKKQIVKQAVDDKVDDYKRRMAQEEQDHQDRMRSREQLGELMDRWETRNMQKNNIRALLSTVHTVLWPESNWQPMSMSQLLAPSGVKKGYQIAMLKFHPDKHQNDPPNVKYICERVFSALNDAWKNFLTENASV